MLDNLTATIFLPYFKQGDDLWHCLKNNKNIGDALLDHAAMLKSAAEQLEEIENLISQSEYSFDDFEICADCHHVSISGPSDLIKLLVEKDLGTLNEDMEDFDDDDIDTELEDEINLDN